MQRDPQPVFVSTSHIRSAARIRGSCLISKHTMEVSFDFEFRVLKRVLLKWALEVRLLTNCIFVHLTFRWVYVGHRADI